MSHLYEIMKDKAAAEFLPAVKEKLLKRKDRFDGDQWLVMIALANLAELEGEAFPMLLRMVPGSIENAQKECDSGNASQCYFYGELLEYEGKEVEAFEFFKKSCTDTNSMGCTKLGDKKLSEGDVKEAKRLYFRGSHSQIFGNAPHKLGDLYSKEGNPREACIWYLTGCLQGNKKDCDKGKDCPGYEKVSRWKDQKKTPFTGVPYEEQQRLLKERQIGYALYSKGMSAMEQGNVEAANELFKKARDSKDAVAVIQLAEIALKRGDIDGAKTVLQESCEGAGEHLACSRLGDIYKNADDFDKAREFYTLSCYGDREACAYDLSQLETNLGNREAAKPYYEFLCASDYGIKEVHEKACESLQVWDAPAENADSRDKACRSGSDSDCFKLAVDYVKRANPKKGLEYNLIVCDRLQGEYDCDYYLMQLWSMGQWEAYRQKVRELCPKIKKLCVREAVLEESLGNSDEALRIFQDACLAQHDFSACRQMRRLMTYKFSIEEQKSFYDSRCLGGDGFCCMSMGMLFHKEKNVFKRDEYFKKAQKLMDEPCLKGEFEACTGKAVLQCAMGKREAGQQELAKLCDQRCGRDKIQELALKMRDRGLEFKNWIYKLFYHEDILQPYKQAMNELEDSIKDCEADCNVTATCQDALKKLEREFLPAY